MRGPLLEVRRDGRTLVHVVVPDTLVVGRECDGLVLDDPAVSRRHAELVNDGGRLTVNDLGSSNGTKVNGTRVVGPNELRPGDVVQLGNTDVEVVAREVAVVDDRPAPGRDAGGGARGTVVLGAGGGPDPRTTATPPTEVVTRPDGPLQGADRADDARQTSIIRVASSVDSSSAAGAATRGDGDTVTIVFSDIESSTERAMELGDERWFEVLGVHNEIVRRHLAAHGGTEIKSQGDGFMLTFGSARKATLFCIDVQRELAAHAREHPDVGVRIRIGLHTGEAIVDDDGDLFGKHIIVAARIANLADGGEILASSVVHQIVSSRDDIAFGTSREVTLKGIEGDHTVHEVVWQA